MEKIPYTRSIVGLCDSAVQFFMLDDPVKSGSILFVQHISVEDRTSLAASVRFGRGKDQFHPHWWEEQVTIAVNTVRWMEKPLHIVPDGERVIVRMDGATLGDSVHVEIEGYLTPKVVGARPFRHLDRVQP